METGIFQVKILTVNIERKGRKKVMRSVFLVATRNRFGIIAYGKVLFLFLLMFACFTSFLHAGQAPLPDMIKISGDTCPTKEEIVQKTTTLQMPFITNNGQMDEQVKFYAKTFGGTVFVTKTGEIVYALPGYEKAIGYRLGETPQISLNTLSGLNNVSSLDWCSSFSTLYSYLNFSKTIPRSIALTETIIGAKIDGITGVQPSVTTVNYFKGNDKLQWKTNVPAYDMVNLGEVYQGIELSLKAYGDNVEKLFCVKPGASPAFIKVQLTGANSLRVNHGGQLEADTELGPVKFTRPIAYQKIEGKRVDVAVEYNVHESGIKGKKDCGTRGQGGGELDTPDSKPETQNLKLIYGFIVASYDKTKDLIIDPMLASTFLGGTNGERGMSIALGKDGSVYMTGNTKSSDFPVTNGSTYSGGEDVFVSMLTSGLGTLTASTFLGGPGDDWGLAIAIDRASGNVCVAGGASTGFPTTTGAYDTTYNGSVDAFVSVLNSGLTSLVASTYLGGSGDDGSTYSLAIDPQGNVYVTGRTSSANFPTTTGAYDSTLAGDYDVFVSKLNGGLTTLLASTFIGKSGRDIGYSIALDTLGLYVYVTGRTESPDFPTTSGAFDQSWNSGVDDAFVLKLNSGLTNLEASTFLGGNKFDVGNFLILDSSGYVYVTGWTKSKNFPTTLWAYDTTYNGGSSDVFVSKLDGKLETLVASTFLGGKRLDASLTLCLDRCGSVYVTGWTKSKNFPTRPWSYDTTHNGNFDAFVSRLNSDLTILEASTFLGKSAADYGYALAINTNNAMGTVSVYVGGMTSSASFPTTTGAYDTTYNGNVDTFITKLDDNL